jgi:hypothetical protein
VCFGPAVADKEKYVGFDACAVTAAGFYTRTASLDTAFGRTCYVPTTWHPQLHGRVTYLRNLRSCQVIQLLGSGFAESG